MRVILISLVAVFMAACTGSKNTAVSYDALVERIDSIIAVRPGQFGVAVIVDSRDTVTVNNSDDYPLMSMFKLHEALGVCHVLDSLGQGLDSIVTKIGRAHV